jgi:hypothetical protein
MKRFAACAGVLVALAVALPAYAQPGDGSRRLERQQQMREFHRQREFRREQDFQRRHRERQQLDEERAGRLTPEERRQLRRDIREHGRDVYRNPQRD